MNKTMSTSMTVMGRITNIVHRGTFALGEVLTDEVTPPFTNRNVRWIGGSDAINGCKPGDRVTFRGTFADHPQYGKQIRVTESRPDMEIQSGGLATWIANNPRISGIGPVKAKKLVAEFVSLKDLKAAIAADPDGVAAAIGVHREAIESLSTALSEDDILTETRAWLAELGLTDLSINKIVNRYGSQTKRILEENPYAMIREIDQFGFRRVDYIAQRMGIPKTHTGRIRAAIVYALQQENEDGHQWTEAKDLEEAAGKLLAMDTLDAGQRIQREMVAMTNSGIDTECPDHHRITFKMIRRNDPADAGSAPPINSNNFHMCYALASAWWHERTIADTTTSSLSTAMATTSSLNYSGEAELNDGQREALDLALRNRITLITGGAGSGKTYLIGALVSVLRSHGKTIELAAPTGKAAQRIKKSTGHPAQTIHRLLGYNPALGWVYNKSNRLRVDCVIIDESSMIDSALLFRVMEGIDAERMIFVGDAEQLPPVGAGAPFRDLIASGKVPTARLTQCMRQAGLLKWNASQVLNGVVAKTPEKTEPPKAKDTETKPPKAKAIERFPWYFFNAGIAGKAFTNSDNVHEFVKNLLSSIPKALGFNLDEVQFLTALSERGALSAKALNELIQEWIHENVYKNRLKPDEIGQFHPGDRVIQTKNDYELGRGVFNGTLGRVQSCDQWGQLIVDFEDGQSLKLKKSNLKNLALAYALTVHKAQGSEFPCVVTICSKMHCFLTHRNWLYTAVTRAQKCSILIGDPKGVYACVGKTEKDKRRTFLSLREF